MDSRPKITVIVPFYNAARTIRPCLKSILANDYDNFEVICVDDRSTDDGPAIAAEYDVTLLQMIRRAGAAAARNLAAAASEGEIYYFVDADVIVPPNIISKIARAFDDLELNACFGAYTIMPAASNFASVYKNFIHHHTHLTSDKHAATFWCGCGAIRRQVFEKAQGFNEDYTASSVEDIELGYRLTKTGAAIRLRTDLRVTHAKRYTLPGLIRSDLFDRAIPWTLLMARQNIFRADLNLKFPNILSGIILALFLPFTLIYLFVLPKIFGLYLLAALLAAYFALNFRVWWYVARIKGLFFSLLFLGMLIITYMYSVLGFIIGLILYIKERLTTREAA